MKNKRHIHESKHQHLSSSHGAFSNHSRPVNHGQHHKQSPPSGGIAGFKDLLVAAGGKAAAGGSNGGSSSRSSSGLLLSGDTAQRRRIVFHPASSKEAAFHVDGEGEDGADAAAAAAAKVGPGKHAAAAGSGAAPEHGATAALARALREIGFKPGRELYSDCAIKERLAWRSPARVGPGLSNLGNTCFLNATLQCLLHCAPLVQHLLEHKYPGGGGGSGGGGSVQQQQRQQLLQGRGMLNGGGEEFRRHDALGMFVEVLQRARRAAGGAAGAGAITPKALVANIRSIGRQFRPGRQEDAHEFLRKLVDSMAEAVLRRHGVKANTPHRLDETTAINRVFGGYLRNQVQCTKCRYCSNTYELYMDLSLDIVGNVSSVEEALRRFQAPETLDRDNRWRCGGCEQKVCARKQLTIHTAPNTLVLHLKRFAYGRHAAKIRRHVSYPEQLELAVSGPERRARYQLSGVVVHEGSTMQFGHYYAFVRASNKAWYRMDDSHVSSVSSAKALGQQAYLLFYARKPDPVLRPPSAPPTPTAQAQPAAATPPAAAQAGAAEDVGEVAVRRPAAAIGGAGAAAAQRKQQHTTSGAAAASAAAAVAEEPKPVRQQEGKRTAAAERVPAPSAKAARQAVNGGTAAPTAAGGAGGSGATWSSDWPGAGWGALFDAAEATAAVQPDEEPGDGGQEGGLEAWQQAPGLAMFAAEVGTQLRQPGAAAAPPQRGGVPPPHSADVLARPDTAVARPQRARRRPLPCAGTTWLGLFPHTVPGRRRGLRNVQWVLVCDSVEAGEQQAGARARGPMLVRPELLDAITRRRQEMGAAAGAPSSAAAAVHASGGAAASTALSSVVGGAAAGVRVAAVSASGGSSSSSSSSDDDADSAAGAAAAAGALRPRMNGHASPPSSGDSDSDSDSDYLQPDDASSAEESTTEESSSDGGESTGDDDAHGGEGAADPAASDSDDGGSGSGTADTQLSRGKAQVVKVTGKRAAAPWVASRSKGTLLGAGVDGWGDLEGDAAQAHARARALQRQLVTAQEREEAQLRARRQLDDWDRSLDVGKTKKVRGAKVPLTEDTNAAFQRAQEAKQRGRSSGRPAAATPPLTAANGSSGGGGGGGGGKQRKRGHAAQSSGGPKGHVLSGGVKRAKHISG